MIKRSVGIYVSKGMLQMVVLSRALKGVKIIAADSIKVPPGTAIGTPVLRVREVEPREGEEAQQKPARTPFEEAVFNLLKEHNIKDGEALTIAIPPEFIVIRYFQMPRLTLQEQKTAIPFEARKYLPYKLEDINFAYNVSYDKVASNKMAVTFVAVEKTTVSNYVRFFTNIGMRAGCIEAVTHSLMRLFYFLSAKDAEPTQTAALIHIGQEFANINLLRNKVLYLTRNVSFLARAASQAPAAAPGPRQDLTADAQLEAQENTKFDGLFAEIRLSFDYFHRQFPEEKIEKMVVWTDDEKIKERMKDAGKDLNIPVKLCNPLDGIEAAGGYPVEYAIGCGLALERLYKAPMSVNLSPAFKRMEIERLVKISIFEACLAIAVLFMFYLSDVHKLRGLERELDQIMRQLPAGSYEMKNMPQAAVEGIKRQRQEKFNSLQQLIEGRISFSSKLNKIGQILPDGLWIRDLNYDKPKGRAARQVLTLRGYAYVKKGEDPIKKINQFLEKLRQSREFSRGFKEIKLESIVNDIYANIMVTGFQISCSAE